MAESSSREGLTLLVNGPQQTSIISAILSAQDPVSSSPSLRADAKKILIFLSIAGPQQLVYPLVTSLA